MSRSQILKPIGKIGLYTVSDHVRQRSFIVMLSIGAAFVFFTRGCYQGTYLVNGRMMGAGTVAGSVSKVSFHSIALAMMILAALLAMRAFSRDRENGMQAGILAKPITRGQYVAGKVIGLWSLAFACMFILHAIVFGIIALKVKVCMPSFLAASVLCSLNLALVIISVLIVSLFLPDFVAFMAVMTVAAISFVSNGIHALNQSQMLRTIPYNGAESQTGLTWKTILYHVWPKISELQITAAALIDRGWSWGWGSIYPLVNILAYWLILLVLLRRRFNEEEIR